MVFWLHFFEKTTKFPRDWDAFLVKKILTENAPQIRVNLVNFSKKIQSKKCDFRIKKNEKYLKSKNEVKCS